MPAKGKHRRPKAPRFTRSIAVAGTGGAALVLPFFGATGAHAATAQSVSGKAVQSLPSVAKTAAKKAAAQQNSGVRTYTVQSGDWLAKIADDQHVSGGWQRLYDDNRQAVGQDPSLIHPGLKLSLGGQAAQTHTEPSAPAPARAPQSQAADTSGAATAPSTGYTLPVTGATIGTGYHVAGSMWSSGYHTGVDFVVPTGTSLKAVAAGTVVSAGWGGAYGNQVVIKLNDGYYAQYGHLSQLSVSAGQTVTAGQQIGLSGATGNVTGPHLHFEIRTTPNYGSDIDPVGYLRTHGVAV
ncbi:LysM peptidoglycan-binding domain-containing M23 family metallopeptidase [Streptomyces sp. Ag109_G2-15]|uniref:M23 family metallopeptidase n=1 Tax=Streptomyces sp. Ag109_G2-15 TaxID=1938850 RepID=UPI000BDC156A|nr:LysM peptidoglycan-binding domain-containing M23 family metallopeptidase [Streptomyces sp. Ag109_G2-15]SOE07735.1 Murein DD-endopeptidase MepM and murein hydrolase activator NlpD, contain LysM domain [Streptomyces sp. Ag109_G2-15]